MKDAAQPMISVGMSTDGRVILATGGDGYIPLTTSLSPSFARHLGRLLMETADFAESRTKERTNEQKHAADR